jgi:hypothetical protein
MGHTYEFKLTAYRPTVTVNQDTGEATHGSETWLWIRIERPIVSFDVPDPLSLDLSGGLSPDLGASTTAFNSNTGWPKPPPNFSFPIPSSWVVFAAPLAHVTVYPETVENVPPSPETLKWRPGRPSLKLHKRIDYDFSHDGLPLFEFSSAGLFDGQRTDFLSVERMRGFCAGDQYKEYSDEEYNAMYEEWLQRGGIEGGGFGTIPCPCKGVWWREFYRRVGEDYEMWQRVKRAMEKGKCRIVLRWWEFNAAKDDDDNERGGRDGNGDGKGYDGYGNGKGSGNGKGKGKRTRKGKGKGKEKGKGK